MKRIEDIKEFEDIDTYYEISEIVEEVFQDRVEAHKHLVTANKEIRILNNRINAIENQLQKKENIIKELEKYMEHYIEVEDAPINERIKIEFKELLKIIRQGGNKMKIEELIQCLEAVSSYEKGEGENIIQYENEFLLSNQDIKVLLKYIKNKDSVIKEVREYIEKNYDDYEEFIYGKEFKEKILKMLGDKNNE